MSSAFSLPRKPRVPAKLDAWFQSLAGRLLHDALLTAGSTAFRIQEVEIYYHSNRHPDPFVHKDPLQREWCRWYFHRQGRSFRGGSFKGLDVTIGDGSSYGGVLIRALSQPGRHIEGPSLCVDEILRCTGTRSVAELDNAIAGRRAVDPSNPLFLIGTCRTQPASMLQCARVGLTAHRTAHHRRFAGRHYRFLTDGRRTRKGANLIARALFQQGRPIEDIADMLGRSRRVIERWVARS